MKILHYDCLAGISGDMNLSALIDLGVDFERIISELKKLNISEEWNIEKKVAERGGITGTQINVSYHDHGVEHCNDHHHRTFKDIKDLIEKSTLADSIKRRAIKIFYILAEAEGEAHKRPIEEVHFHEVGAVDSIIDIVGCAIGIELLGVDKITSGEVELGGGKVECAHGIMDVPAPATKIISKKFPHTLGGANHECTTPTGAAIIASIVDEFSNSFDGEFCKTGIGVGHRDCKEIPNVLRVTVFESSKNNNEKVYELSANIDDMTPEHISYLNEKLFESGALDVWQEPIYMKKNRAGVKVSAICSEKNLSDTKKVFFKNSTTLGLRIYPIERETLNRDTVLRSTEYGIVRFKKSFLDGKELRQKPEFEDCKKIAKEKNIAIDKLGL